MGEPATDPIAELRATVAAAAAEVHGAGEVEPPSFERPPRAELGDFSTNAALLAAPLTGENPREVATRIGAGLRERLGGSLERIEVAGPGFLNMFMAGPWLDRAMAAVAEAGDRFGSGVAAGRAQRVLVEFVSANPTGPITVAAGRHAAYGDSLARIMEFAGHAVERDYYVNDAGRQVWLFGESIGARIAGGDPPEDGYQGEYVSELAARLREEGLEAEPTEQLARRGIELMRESIEASLARFRVRFDRWSSERELHEAGAVRAAIEVLRERDLVYERDGATWLRTTASGDDKDRVLIRADGEPTYFASDIAYHREKLERGVELMVDVLGADHHGYVPRMRAAVAGLGASPERFEAPIMQLVHLIDGGERAQMSKRKGEFATLDELIEDIGVDAARFFLIQRDHDTTLDLDLELARRRSNENPVYYVQYAHARICSIFRAADNPAESEGEPAGPDEGSERGLLLRLLELPGQIERAEVRREPHGLAAFARTVAADFHAFYRDCPVLKAPEPDRSRRLELIGVTRTVIATTLSLLGIEAPEEM